MKNTSQEILDATKGLTFTVNGVSFVMKHVEGGTIKLGYDDGDIMTAEKRVHEETVGSFYMGETLVTQALWKAVTGTTIEHCRDRVERFYELKGHGDDYPMYFVSWHDCQRFLAKLNELTGKTFRMPTEEEWEFAARGGIKSHGYLYAGSNDLDEVAWYAGNSFEASHPVKTKLPNELGLYDMSGNVWEWCGRTDHDGLYRFHGGAWDCEPKYCRVSCRPSDESNIRYSNIGFRIVF